VPPLPEPNEALGVDPAAARETAAANPVWYHTIDLAPGVATPGQIDHRSVVDRVLPGDLRGKRCLDVGTFDGFWAFAMERRGAAEVVATDVERVDAAEWPPHRRPELEAKQREFGTELGRGFELASRVLGSTARREVCSIYDLGPERPGGKFDFVFIGALLLHLRDPVRALERTRSVLRDGGELRLFEPYAAGLGLRARRLPVARFQPLETSFNWWLPNLAALEAWLRVAGFPPPRRLAKLTPTAKPEMRQRHVVLSVTP
jgi:tRNA (mo5U34)-methyltransferase